MSDGAEAVMRPDEASFRTVLGHFATGVTIVTSMDGDTPCGLAANSFTSVSIDPPMVLFCAAKDSSTWPKIKAAGSFAVNILGDDQEDICRVFATRGADRFSRIGWRASGGSSSPLLHEALAYVDCTIENEYDAGDHVVVIGKVIELGVTAKGGPLLFYRGGYGRFEA